MYDGWVKFNEQRLLFGAISDYVCFFRSGDRIEQDKACPQLTQKVVLIKIIAFIESHASVCVCELAFTCMRNTELAICLRKNDLCNFCALSQIPPTVGSKCLDTPYISACCGSLYSVEEPPFPINTHTHKIQRITSILPPGGMIHVLCILRSSSLLIIQWNHKMLLIF